MRTKQYLKALIIQRSARSHKYLIQLWMYLFQDVGQELVRPFEVYKHRYRIY